MAAVRTTLLCVIIPVGIVDTPILVNAAAPVWLSVFNRKMIDTSERAGVESLVLHEKWKRTNNIIV